MNISIIFLIVLILANTWMSWKAFEEYKFMDRYVFQIEPILKGKEYIRLLSSGFLHGGWLHLGINMYVLWNFGTGLLQFMNPILFSVIYFASLVGGNLLALKWRAKEPHYTAVGASGAVSGIVFSMIALNPSMGMGIIFIPISFPAWLLGIAFIGWSVYGMYKKNDNIGHEAHLGGAVVGFLLTLLLV